MHLYMHLHIGLVNSLLAGLTDELDEQEVSGGGKKAENTALSHLL